MAARAGYGLQVGGGAGFQLFTQTADNQPAIYTGVDQTAAESARDVYFGANPADLATLDANEFLIIKLVLTGTDPDTAIYQQRQNSTWVDVTSLIQGESGSSATSLQAGTVAVSDGSEFTSQGINVDQSTGEVTFDDTVNVPSGSINVGEALQLSEGVADLVIVDKLKDSMAFSVNSDFSDAGGASTPAYFKFGDPFNSNINLDDTQTLTANPLNFSITGAATLPDVTLVDRATLKTNGPMANVTMRVTDNATGLAVRYLPSKAAWEGSAPGLSLGGPLEIMFFFAEEGTDTATEYYFGFVPFLVENGQQLDFSFKGDSVDLKGEIGGTPYLVLEVHDGPPTDLADRALAIRSQATGLLEGGLISAASGTTVDWTAGSGQVADYDNPESPVISEVTWAAVTGFTPTNIASTDGTFIAYNAAGSMVEILASALTAANERENIIIGLVAHTSGTITNIITAPLNVAYDGIESFNTFMSQIIGPANVDGNIYGANGTNLNIDVLGGRGFFLGSNFRNDPGFSDIVSFASAAPVTFLRSYRSTGAGAIFEPSPTTLIGPTMYDNGSGTLQTVPAGNWTIQRIFRSRDGGTTVTYGQEIFASKSLALESLGSEQFEEQTPFPYMLYRCALLIAEDATDLSDTGDAEFFNQSSFRITGAQSAASSVPGITSPGGSNESIQFNNGGVFGGDSNLTYNTTTKTLGLKPPSSGTTTIEFVDFSDVSVATIQYNDTTDAFIINPTNTAKTLQIGAGIFMIEGAADSRLDIEAITTSGTAQITLSDAGGGTGLMIDYDDNTNKSVISGEVGPLELITATDEDIAIVIGGATSKLGIINVSSPDTNPLLELLTSGANGGQINFYVGSRAPEGLITADGGALYFRDSGTSSDLFLKRSDGGNTGWTDFLHASSGVQGPSSSTDTAVALWDGTTGALLADSPLTVIDGVTSNSAVIFSPSVTGIAGFAVEDSSNVLQGVFEYLEGTDLVRILTTTDLDLHSSDNIDIDTQSATGVIGISGSALPDTLPLMAWETGGANGSTMSVFLGTRNPEGNVTGNPGSFYFQSNGADSSIYQHRSGAVTNTGWKKIFGDLDGPDTSVNNAIASWNGTAGNLLSSEGNFRAVFAASVFTIELEAPGTNDTARYELQDSLGVQASYLQFNDNTKLTLMLSLLGDLEVGSQFNDLILSVNDNVADIQLVGYQLPDTQNLLNLETGGANGAAINMFVGSRSPLNNVTGSPGDVYFSKNGASSSIFIHEGTGATTTDWIDLISSSSGVTGPSSSTDTAVALWDGTTGKLLSDSPLTVIDGATTNSAVIFSPSVTGIAGFAVEDSSNVLQGVFEYLEGTDLVRVLTTTDLEILSSDDILIQTQDTAGVITFADGSSNVARISGETGGALNTVRIYTGSTSAHLVLEDTATDDLFTLEGLGDGTDITISMDASTNSLIRSSSTELKIQTTLGSGRLVLESLDDIDVLADETVIIESLNDRVQIQSGAGTGAEILSLASTTASRISKIFVENSDPNGVVTGAGGDILVRDDTDESALYFNMAATVGAVWQRISVNPVDIIEIHNSSEFEALATAGVISITVNTLIIFKESINTASRFDATLGANLNIYGNGEQVVFLGTGTFFTGDDCDIYITELRLVKGVSGTLFDIKADSQSSVRLAQCLLVNWEMGSIRPLDNTLIGPLVNFVETVVAGWGSGLTLTNCLTLRMTGFRVAQLSPLISANQPFINVSTVQAEFDVGLTGMFGTLSAGETLIRVDPAWTDGAPVNITNSPIKGDGGALFDTSGATGTFTVVADAAVSATAITSVTDSSGIARFNFTVGPTVFVNQEVVVSTFVTNTAYNGIFIITATGVGYFEVSSVPFGTTETGSFLSNSVTMTDTGTALVNGDTLTIDTDLSTQYDGGATVYNQLTNSFQINRTFGATQTGSWSTNGIDQSDPRVLASSNSGYESSHYIATSYVNNNATPNGTITNNTFRNMEFGALIAGSTMERWKLINDTAGVFIYTGLEPFAGHITFDFTSVSSGGIVDFRYKWEINDGGGFVDLPDAVEALVSIGSDSVSVTKTFPLRAETGWSIRPRITRNSGSSTVTTFYATMYITQDG